jgi:hypothetical protein
VTNSTPDSFELSQLERFKTAKESVERTVLTFAQRHIGLYAKTGERERCWFRGIGIAIIACNALLTAAVSIPAFPFRYPFTIFLSLLATVSTGIIAFYQPGPRSYARGKARLALERLSAQFDIEIIKVEQSGEPEIRIKEICDAAKSTLAKMEAAVVAEKRVFTEHLKLPKSQHRLTDET